MTAIVSPDGQIIEIQDVPNGNGHNMLSGAKESIQGRSQPYPFGLDGPGQTVPILGDILSLAMSQRADEVPAWSYYPLLRDRYLNKVWRSEDHMSGAIYSVQAKMLALPWTVKVKGKPRATMTIQEVFGRAGFGAGFSVELGKATIDVLTKDNGFFFELIGKGNPSQPLTSPITEIAHMDSMCCWRTHDPTYPVVYTNPLTGQYHALHKSRVVYGSSMTQPDELARGIGYCAVSRTLKSLQIMRDIQIYRHEKISGRFTKAIGYGNGITPKQFQKAVQQSEAEDEAAGLVIFRRIPWILSQHESMNLNLLSLASLPDNFDFEKEVNLYMYALALGFGMDAREFWPATASGATKADAAIQHLKAQNKGFADIISTFVHAFNWHPSFPLGFVLDFDYVDDEQDAGVAQIHSVKVDNLQKLVTMGALKPEEARAVAIAWGIIEPEYLKLDEIPIQADDVAPVVPADSQLPSEVLLPAQPVQPPQPVNPKIPAPAPAMPDILKQVKELYSSITSETALLANIKFKGEDNVPAGEKNSDETPEASQEQPAKSAIHGSPLPEDQALESDPVTMEDIQRALGVLKEVIK